MVDFIAGKYMNETILDRLIKDIVISAYVATVFNPKKLEELGLQIAINTSTNKTRSLGTSQNPIYPEIVVWKPDNPYMLTGGGKAVLVVCIENEKTLEKNIYKFIFLASLGIIFNLVVEEKNVDYAKQILKNANIDLLVKLQKYKFNANTKRYNFSNA
jgi:hypothetical protein